MTAAPDPAEVRARACEVLADKLDWATPAMAREWVEDALAGKFRKKHCVVDIEIVIDAMIALASTTEAPPVAGMGDLREDQAQLLGDCIEQRFGVAVPASWSDAMVDKLAALTKPTPPASALPSDLLPRIDPDTEEEAELERSVFFHANDLNTPINARILISTLWRAFVGREQQAVSGSTPPASVSGEVVVGAQRYWDFRVTFGGPTIEEDRMRWYLDHALRGYHRYVIPLDSDPLRGMSATNIHIAKYAAPEAATPSAVLDHLSERVAEIMREDGGCWHACSGCQESVDGCVSFNDYPYSEVFQCQPGGGCSECGGIGVLWEDGAFLSGYADAALTANEAPSAVGGVDRMREAALVCHQIVKKYSARVTASAGDDDYAATACTIAAECRDAILALTTGETSPERGER
jgi:hypothetical protein